MQEIIEEASEKLGKQYETAWSLDGIQVKTPMDMAIQARILILSDGEEFLELGNIDKFSMRG